MILVVQNFVLIVVIAGERGAEGSYLVPKDPTKSTELCTASAISCKVTVGPVEYPDPIRVMDLFFYTTILTLQFQT